MIWNRKPAYPPPRLLSRWPAWVLLAAFLLVPFFVTFPAALRRHLLIGMLSDLAHVPLLAGVTLFLYWTRPLRGRLWLAAAASVVVGILIEIGQNFVGRTALLGDVFLDMVGTGVAVGWVVWRGHRLRTVGIAIILLSLAYLPHYTREMPANYRARSFHLKLFPVLDDFENFLMNWMWTDLDAAAIGFPPVPDGPVGPSFVLQIQGAPPQRWPGAKMGKFPHDWRGYDRLTFAARHRGRDDRIAEFAVRVSDWAGRKENAGALSHYVATAEWQTFEFPLQDRACRGTDHVLDLAEIETLNIFLLAPADTTILQVDDLKLE